MELAGLATLARGMSLLVSSPGSSLVARLHS